jgi:hypothetical protein
MLLKLQGSRDDGESLSKVGLINELTIAHTMFKLDIMATGNGWTHSRYSLKGTRDFGDKMIDPFHTCKGESLGRLWRPRRENLDFRRAVVSALSNEVHQGIHHSTLLFEDCGYSCIMGDSRDALRKHLSMPEEVLSHEPWMCACYNSVDSPASVENLETAAPRTNRNPRGDVHVATN